jgi:MarR family transcriptional regulator, organic hydroperoxide resistance regulator
MVHAPATPLSSAAEDDERLAIVARLSALSLPLMWSLRQRAMQVYEPLGVRPTRVLLMELVDRGIDRPKQIAEVLEAVPPAVTAMVNELMEKGWLAREQDAGDRRRVHLHLTPSGHEALADLRRAWRDAERADLERIATDQLRTVLHVFESLLGGRP